MHDAVIVTFEMKALSPSISNFYYISNFLSPDIIIPRTEVKYVEYHGRRCRKDRYREWRIVYIITKERGDIRAREKQPMAPTRSTHIEHRRTEGRNSRNFHNALTDQSYDLLFLWTPNRRSVFQDAPWKRVFSLAKKSAKTLSRLSRVSSTHDKSAPFSSQPYGSHRRVTMRHKRIPKEYFLFHSFRTLAIFLNDAKLRLRHLNSFHRLFLPETSFASLRAHDHLDRISHSTWFIFLVDFGKAIHIFGM